MKYVLILIAVLLTSYTIYISFSEADQTLLDKTIEHNNKVYDRCFGIGGEAYDSSDSNGHASSDNDSGSGVMASGSVSMTDSRRYKASYDCWQSQRKLLPDDLFLTVPRKVVDSGQCAISQTEDQHVRPERGGMYATDLACNFPSQGVYAPDYLDDMKEYTIAEVGYDSLMGNFIILEFKDSPDMRWYFGHTVLDAGWNKGDTVTTGVRFAYADLSGVTTGYHTHIEFRRLLDGVWQSVRYVTRSKERKLEEKRLSGMDGTRSGATIVSSQGQSGSGNSENVVYYFTHYALGDVSQNDNAPCISADGKDSCLLQKHGRGTMALTVDIRNKMGIKFGDKVALTGDVGCEGVYTVTDEMACRFRGEYAWANGPCAYRDGTPTPRISHIKRPGTNYYIKGDLPGKAGGACSIKKL